MSLSRNGKEFLDLVDHIESFSRKSHEMTSPPGETI
jgi:hypothetical protein